MARPAPACLTSLTHTLAASRGDVTPKGYRERAYVLDEIGRLRTKESQKFLLELAQRENGDFMERLAAIGALDLAGDTKAIETIAATTSDTLVHAKIRALRERDARSLRAGGKS